MPTLKDTIEIDLHPPNPLYPWLVRTDNGSRQWHSKTHAHATTELAEHRAQREVQRRELARTIADECEAIASGTVTGPAWSAARRVESNVMILVAWTPDDRS